MHEPGFFDFSEHLDRLSLTGDPLEPLVRHVDFEAFRPVLAEALGYGDRPKGGTASLRPGDDVQGARAGLDAQPEQRADGVPDPRPPQLASVPGPCGQRADTGPEDDLAVPGKADAGGGVQVAVRGLRGAAPVARLQARGRADRRCDPDRRPAPAHDQGREEAGEDASDIWPDKPARASQKDTDARWTIKHSRAGRTGNPGDDAGLVDIAVPHFGYKNHISIDRKWGFIRGESGTDAARNYGHELANVLDRENGCRKVWADTAYRSADNEMWLDANGFKSCIHRRKPKGRPMPKHIRRGNATRSAVRAHVEHVFGCRKGPMDLTIRCIGRIRAAGQITMANLTYNFRRAVHHERRRATA